MSCGVNEVMVLECVDCPATITLPLAHHLSDAEAAPHFYRRGWSIKPTLCPRCLAARLDNE
jgi:hypothetical protein